MNFVVLQQVVTIVENLENGEKVDDVKTKTIVNVTMVENIIFRIEVKIMVTEDNIENIEEEVEDV